VVYQWGQVGEEGSLEATDWQVDTFAGAHAGETAVHPGELEAGASALFTFDCDGRQHTQLRFFAQRQSGAELQLSVDELHRAGLSRSTRANGYWDEIVVDVDPGSHRYEFFIETDAALPRSYVLDSFECLTEEPAPGPNGFVDFDDGFIPVEMKGGWFVDNIAGVHSGDAAVRAPELLAGDEASFEFSCTGEAHTQLRFFAQRQAGIELDMAVENAHRARLASSTRANGYWDELIFTGKPSPRTYSFALEKPDQDTPRSFVLDSFACLEEEPKAAHNGFITFDQGFLPLEVEGDWVVDNVAGVHEGDQAIRPPELVSGDRATLTVHCEAPDHSRLRFFAQRQSGAELTLAVGDEHRASFLSSTRANGYWDPQTVDSEPPGPRTYTFQIVAETDLPRSYVLDTFICE
jgi:hypothetical protein